MSSSHSKHPKNNPIDAQASDAADAIQKIADALPLENVAPDPKVARAFSRVSLEVMTIAARILSQYPERFPGLDGEILEEAILYQTAMAPLASAVEDLGDRILRNVRKRRSAGATQTLALYQMLKGHARVTANDPLATELLKMEKLLTTYRKRRATTVTQKEVDQNKSMRRKAKIVAAKEAEMATKQAEIDVAKRNAGVPVPDPNAGGAAPPPAPVPTR